MLLAAGWLAAGCGGPPAGAPPPPTPDRPNILLITLESVRADHVGCYGYPRQTTPSLDALAAEGTRFEKAYAVTSWTLPSHASIFTGLYPAAHGVVAHDDRLDPSHTTLAEALSGAGYQCAALISGPFLQSPYQLDQGFELYDESASNPEGNRAAHADVTNPQMERLLNGFLRENRSADRPFFLFVYLWDPHYDYIPPPPWNARFVPPGAEPFDIGGYETSSGIGGGLPEPRLAWVVSQYDGEIGATDALLGRLWGLLRDLGLWDRTAIVVTADHGEEFFEHGSKGHRNNVYEEAVHVPLVVKPAGGALPAVDPTVVSLVDLYPTILELGRVEAASHHHGRSLLQPPPAEQRPVFFELKTEWLARDPASGQRGIVSDLWLAVREGDHKLVLSRNQSRRELYDLAADPGERHPLGPDHAARAQALGSRIDRYLETMRQDAGRFGRSPPVRLRPEQEERLRSLGYVGREPSEP